MERLSHWTFDYAQTVTPITCVTVLHVNVFQGKMALTLDYWSVLWLCNSHGGSFKEVV